MTRIMKNEGFTLETQRKERLKVQRIFKPLRLLFFSPLRLCVNSLLVQ